MPYSSLTKSALNDNIANKLGDEGKVYRTETEINLLIKEAILTFGAISGYWKNALLVETTDSSSVVDKQLYNIMQAADVKSGIDYVKSSLTYQDILDWLDVDLIGYSSLVDDEVLFPLISNAINIFQRETKLVLDVARFNVEIGQPISLSSDVLDIVAAYYIDSSGIYYNLNLAEESNIALIRTDYTTTNSRPRFYSLANLSISILDLIPKPIENGFIEIIYVKGISDNVSVDADSSCIVPDNLVPYLKYKIEHDIFAEEMDDFRTTYCQKRWQEGLMIGKYYSAITKIKLNGLNKSISSLLDFNNLRYGWRNDLETASKKVNTVATAGYNIIALNRMPINVHSILLEVIANAPYQAVNIDLRPDYVPFLVDYIIHLASIKDGIAAIQQTQLEFNRFLQVAVNHNQYLQNSKTDYIKALSLSKYPIKQARLQQQEAEVIR